MSMGALFSVIIVNYNSRHYLTECVASLLTENKFPIEILIVDNASTDDSLALLTAKFENHPQIHILRNLTNEGFSKANNQGITVAKGHYFLFLNPDCVIKSDTLNKMYQVMEDHPKAGMAGCLIRNPDGSVQATCIRSIPNPWNSLVRVLHLEKFFTSPKLQKLDLGGNNDLPNIIQSVPAISGAFMVVRRAALDDVGLLDERYFLYCEDTDWMLRFNQKGWQILFVPDAEIVHAKGISSRQTPLRVLWYKHTGMIRFCHKFYSQQYSAWFLGLIYLGIGLRFFLLSFITMGRSLFNWI